MFIHTGINVDKHLVGRSTDHLLCTMAQAEVLEKLVVMGKCNFYQALEIVVAPN